MAFGRRALAGGAEKPGSPGPAASAASAAEPWPPAGAAEPAPAGQAAPGTVGSWQGRSSGHRARSSGVPPPGRPGDEAWAMLGYLLVPFFAFVPALVIYLLRMRGSAFARAHAAQALGLGLALFLYSLCAAIVGGLLAIESVATAAAVAGTALAVLWLTALAYAIRAGTAASSGGYAAIPSWLCATVTRR